MTAILHKRYLGFRFLVLLAMCFALAACATTTAVLIEGERPYPPEASTMIFPVVPEEGVRIIAILETRGMPNMDFPSMLESMRKKGQDIGAHAVVPVADLSYDQHGFIMFNPLLGGYQTMPGQRVPIIRGVALRFD